MAEEIRNKKHHGIYHLIPLLKENNRVLVCKNLWSRVQVLCRLLKDYLTSDCELNYNRYLPSEDYLEKYNQILDVQVEVVRARNLQRLLAKREILNMEITTFEDVLQVEKELKARIFRLNRRLPISRRSEMTLLVPVEADKEEWQAYVEEIQGMEFIQGATNDDEPGRMNQFKRKKYGHSFLARKRNESRRVDSTLFSVRFCANLIAEIPSEKPNQWILYDYLHSESTDEATPEIVPLTYRVKLHIAISIASGLAAAHKIRSTHLNLTSASVLLEEDCLIPHIICNDTSSLTIDESPYWRAPETFHPQPSFGKESDIWALGVILWELFTEKMPFNAETDFSLVKDLILNNQYPGEVVGIEDEVACIILSCWELNPVKRPSSEQVLNSLKKIRNERNIWLETCLDFAGEGHLQLLKIMTDNDKIWTKEEVSRELLFATVKSSPKEIAKKQIKVLEWLTEEKGLSLMTLDKDGNTLLHRAALELAPEIFYWLIVQNRIDIHRLNHKGESVLSIVQTKKDDYGNTLLHHAASSENFDLVKWLLLNTNIDALSLNNNQIIPFTMTKYKSPYTGYEWLYNQTFPLHKAVKDGNIELVRHLIVEGKVQVNGAAHTESALEIAVKKGDLEMVKILVLEGKANIYEEAYLGGTVIHHAAENNFFDILRFLVLECEADMGLIDQVSPTTPLLEAAAKGHIEIVKFLLLEVQCQVENADLLGWTLLHHMARHGCLEITQRLVEEYELDLEPRDCHGFTPLHHAASQGHIEVVKYLVLSGADIKTFNNLDRNSLNLAASKGHLDVVKWLVLACKSDVNSVDIRGSTPLHVAAEAGRLEVVKFLIKEAAANVNMTDKEGMTPFLVAITKRPPQHEVIRWLVNSGNCAYNLIKGVHLNRIIKTGDMESLRLIASECDMNKADNSYGKTPLHVAVMQKWAEAVEFLIVECRVSVFQVNNSGETPLHLAAKCGSLDIVKLLVQHGADLEAITRNGKSVYTLAKDKVKRWLKNPT